MTQLRSISIDRIDQSPHNPRRTFSEESLVSLANSISSLGVLQPILVKEISETGRFEIIAGERRWRASKISNIETIPAIVVSLDDPTIHEVQLVENLEREQLNPIDEANAFNFLMQNFGYSYSELARKFKRSYQFIHNRIDLLVLDPYVQQLVAQNKIAIGVALELTKINDFNIQRRLAQEAESEGLTAAAIAARVNYYKHEQKALENKKARISNFEGKQELLKAEGIVITSEKFDPNIHHRIWDLSFTDCQTCQLKGRFLRADLQVEDMCVQPDCYETLLIKQRSYTRLAQQEHKDERHHALERILETEDVKNAHLQYVLWTLLQLMGGAADNWRADFNLARFSDISTSSISEWNEIATWSAEKLITNILRLTLANIAELDNCSLPKGLRDSLINEFNIPQHLLHES